MILVILWTTAVFKISPELRDGFEVCLPVSHGTLALIRPSVEVVLTQPLGVAKAGARLLIGA